MRNFQRLLLVLGLLLIAAGCPEMTEDKPKANAPPSKQPPAVTINDEGVGDDGSTPVEEVDPKEFAKEQAAANELEKTGALVVREGPEKQVTSVNFIGQGKKIDRKTAALLPDLFRVLTINLADTDFDGEQLKFLKNRKLVSLVLGGTKVADKDMVHLANVPSLVSLYLPKTNITDAGLTQIANLSKLAILDVSYTKITNRGLPEIAKLQNLNWLLISGTEVTDEGLLALANLPNLGRLSLMDTKITEQGIASLKASKPGLKVDSGASQTPNGQ